MLLEKLNAVLGADNVKRLEDGITDIMLERIKDDFDCYDTYILEPDEVADFAESCKEKAFKNIETELVQKLEVHMRKSLSLLNDNVEHLSSPIVDFGMEALGGFFIKYDNGTTKLLTGKQVVDKLNGK